MVADSPGWTASGAPIRGSVLAILGIRVPGLDRAIIDVLSGKNMVIIGPPGTGKSQTITNIIAVALSKGNKVLFVSEKLAALEVVRRRLDHAGLGHFCLELHSQKTQKKMLLDDIKARIDQHFSVSPQFQAKMETLQRQKGELARYAKLMGSRFGNALGLTVNEIFWACERRRQGLGHVVATVNAIGFRDASEWTHDDIESRRSRLAALAELYDGIGGRVDQSHPWWGFQPDQLLPSDDEAIARIVAEALESAEKANAAAEEAKAFFGFAEQPDTRDAARIGEMLERIPSLPEEADPSLLSTFFDPDSDPKGQRSARLIADVARAVERARSLFLSAATVLTDGKRPPADKMDEARQLATGAKLSQALLSSDIGDGLELVSRFERALDGFLAAATVSKAPYGAADKLAIDAFIASCGVTASLGLAPFPIDRIASRASAVLDAGKSLSDALSRIGAIASTRLLPFDSTPDAVARLADPEGIPGLLPHVEVSAESLTQARRLAAFRLADRPVSELFRINGRLKAELEVYSQALERCRSSADRLGLAFDSTERAIAELAAIAKVCASAPADLLEYRMPTFGHARTAELIAATKSGLAAERHGRTQFPDDFYLDALPPASDIKASVVAFRRKEGIFAFFDREWRNARRLYVGISREKRKLTAKQKAEELAALAAWIEAKDGFISNVELRDSFGALFRGLETDPGRLETLNDWYLSSRATMAEWPGLSERVDLTAIPAERIAEFSAKVATISADAARLAGAETAVKGILGVGIAWFREAKSKGWGDALEAVRRVVGTIAKVAESFAARADAALSPSDALRLMEVRTDLRQAAADLECLMRGQKSLRHAGGEELGRLADLAGGPWTDALRDVLSKATRVGETASQALAFAERDCPLSAAESFAKAMAELDDSWLGVAAPPPWNQFEDWSALGDVARDSASAARKVLEYIAPYARSGKSVLEVFRATDDETKARASLDELTCSVDHGRKRMLGCVFRGVETDLDGLSVTHRWGGCRV